MLDRAAAQLHAREFEAAAGTLRKLLSIEAANRGAQEMLAFALESMGDLAGEHHVRSALAIEYPDDPRIQADYGRVLERSGDEDGALRAYRRARELSRDGAAAELDAAIERMRGRTAIEVGTPLLAVMSDPDATASRLEAGAALRFKSGHHLAFLGTHSAVNGTTPLGATAMSDELALTFVQRHGPDAYWIAGPRLHLVSPRGGAARDLGVGGALAGRAPVGPAFEADWSVNAETPWDEGAVTVLHGGRTTAAEGHLYAHLLARRLLLQAGARRRRLSILAAEPGSTRRREAWQSLGVAGADVVLWSRPGAAVRGEMLDATLIARTTLSSAITLAYRHYDVSTQTSPEFNAIIGLASRGSVDETSVTTTLASPRSDLGLEAHAGLARDSARPATMWRTGGAVVWAPTPTTRLALGYDEANELAGGLVGQRREGWVSFHVHL